MNQTAEGLSAHEKLKLFKCSDEENSGDQNRASPIAPKKGKPEGSAHSIETGVLPDDTRARIQFKPTRGVVSREGKSGVERFGLDI